MVSTSGTTPKELDAILSAGSNGVRKIYQEFRKQFPTKLMKEVGLTDIFLMSAQWKARQAKKKVQFDWMYKESEFGCDFAVRVNDGPLNQYMVFFQAKVAQQKDKDTYCDFLYESRRIVDGKIVLEYQNLLLARCAQEHKTHAYYVIYDENAVSWVNAIALMNWFERSGVKGTNEEICVAAFKVLAKASYLEAMADPWAKDIARAKF